MSDEPARATPPRREEAHALSAPWTMKFTYTRTFGAAPGLFIAGLADRRVLGLRAPDGCIFVPPTGYDPRTSEALDEWVELPQVGTIESIAWIAEPLPEHPLEGPFGWALVRLDGASSAITHFVRAGDSDQAPEVGDRVSIVWPESASGTILDLGYFVPVAHSGATP